MLITFANENKVNCIIVLKEGDPLSARKNETKEGKYFCNFIAPLL